MSNERRPIWCDENCEAIGSDNCKICEEKYVKFMDKERIIDAYEEYLERECKRVDRRYIIALRSGKCKYAGLMYTETCKEDGGIEWMPEGIELQVKADVEEMKIIYEVEGHVICTEEYEDADEFIENNLEGADFQGWYDQMLDVIWNNGDKVRAIVEETINKNKEI